MHFSFHLFIAIRIGRERTPLAHLSLCVQLEEFSFEKLQRTRVNCPLENFLFLVPPLEA